MNDYKHDYEIVEHTADVGIRAWAGSVEELFEQTTYGLLDIVGARKGDGGEEVVIELRSRDLGGLLVDWLSEVLYLQDGQDAVIASVKVEDVRDGRLRGRVALAPRGEEVLEGTAVKAITYHQLRVEETPDGWEADVYVDV